jgi:hypothetical protein
MLRRGSRRPFPQRGDDLAGFRKAVRLVLRKDPVAVDDNVEDAALARQNFRVDAQLPFDRGCQTGSLGTIVSTNAILNGDVHSEIMISREAIHADSSRPAWHPAIEQ